MPKVRDQSGVNPISKKRSEIAAIVVVGFSLFALFSTASYVENGQPGSESGNLCGATGQAFARYMLHAFGYAGYALYFCLAFWGIVLFVRKNLPGLITKVVGIVFFTVFLAALLSHILSGSTASIPDHGGLVGQYLNSFVTDRLALGIVGARIILIALFMITFILATDWAFFTPLTAFSRWMGEGFVKWRARRREAAETRAARLQEKKAEKEREWKAAAVAAEKERKKEEALRGLLKKEEKKEGPGPAVSPPVRFRPSGRESPAARGARSGSGGGVHYEPPPTKKSRAYKKPSYDLLDNPEHVPDEDLESMIRETSANLENTLRSFKIEASVVEIQRGPVITMFELDVAPGIKVERIRALENNIAMAVRARSVRIVAPVPGKSTVGIEIPNAIRENVRLKEIFTSKDFKEAKSAIPICLGKDAAGRVLVDDLAKMPHLLVAGSTGSGKSVCLNSIIMSVIYTRSPEQVKLILVDPKMVELSRFKKIPHLMCPVVTEMKRAGAILEWATKQMDERYNLLHAAGVRDIYAFNKLGEKELRKRMGIPADDEEFRASMPFVIIIVDELADLMMIGTKEVEANITRLAQKSRAVGIHLVLATQRPSTNVITGLIKANMPTRIAFMVASKIDSRVILDGNGAEKLLGQGDMLYLPPHTSFICRAQGTFVSDGEVRRVTSFIKDGGEPEFEPALVSTGESSSVDPASVDELYDEAAAFIIETQRGSASLLQRHFSIGYTRASRLIDLMQQDGILGEYKGSQAREVVVTPEEWLERKRNKKKKNAKTSHSQM